jgi:hypothetical protein
MKKYFLSLLTIAVIAGLYQCSSSKKATQVNNASQVNLPEPFATPDTRKNSKVIGWPEGKTPIAPEGFM